MDSITLQAAPRTVIGKKVKTLRRQDIVPGVIYGHHIEPLAVQFDARHVAKVLRQVGTSSTVEVTVEGQEEPYLAIFRDTQVDIIRRNLTHVDLQALSLTETVRVPVSVILTGTSPAVELGGVLVHILNELEIEALPNALIPSVEIDISTLENIGDSVSVSDISVPEGVTILNPAADTIVQVIYQIEEELEEEAEEELLITGELLEGEEMPAEEEAEEEEEK
jgi:large subunit ribosomal protein L25